MRWCIEFCCRCGAESRNVGAQGRQDSARTLPVRLGPWRHALPAGKGLEKYQYQQAC